MKNIFKTIGLLVLSGAIALSAVSCGNKNNTTSASTASNGTSATTSISTSGNTASGTTGSTATSEKVENSASTGALGLLNSVWGSYSETEKFFACGGDEDHLNFEGPGEYSVKNGEMLDGVLGFPAELASKIDSAASLSHAMNVNTFTCGAYHFKNASDAEASISKIKENILSRQWVCGFPDSMMIISAPGNYIIALWGIDDGTGVVTTFKNKVLNTIDGAKVEVNEPII